MALITQEKFELTPLLYMHDRCFFCRQMLTFPIVWFQGADENLTIICLHPACAERLAFHLNSDAHDAKV